MKGEEVYMKKKTIYVYVTIFAILEIIGLCNFMKITVFGIIGLSLSSMLLSAILGTVILLFWLLLSKVAGNSKRGILE